MAEKSFRVLVAMKHMLAVRKLQRASCSWLARVRLRRREDGSEEADAPSDHGQPRAEAVLPGAVAQREEERRQGEEAQWRQDVQLKYNKHGRIVRQVSAGEGTDDGREGGAGAHEPAPRSFRADAVDVTAAPDAAAGRGNGVGVNGSDSSPRRRARTMSRAKIVPTEGSPRSSSAEGSSITKAARSWEDKEGQQQGEDKEEQQQGSRQVGGVPGAGEGSRPLGAREEAVARGQGAQPKAALP